MPRARLSPVRIRVRYLALAAAALLVAAPAVPAPAVARGPNHVAFRMTDPRVDESSGIAASIRHPGVVYTVNDSGDSARVFAVGPDGKTRAVLKVSGFVARDWEAVTVGRDERGRPCVYAGDIGDNLDGAWPNVAVFRFPEPARLSGRSVHATRFRLKYAAGARNAEGLMADPRSGRLYVVSKEWNGGVYAAPKRLHPDRMNKLRRVGEAPSIATDAAYAPDGSSFVIRTYFSAMFYDRIGHQVASTLLPSQKQGESITYTHDGRSVLVGSEGKKSPVWRVPVPDGLRPTPTPKPSTAAGGDKTSDDEAGGHSTLTGLVIVLLVAGAGFVILRRRRS